jgi:hypothetical protein
MLHQLANAEGHRRPARVAVCLHGSQTRVRSPQRGKAMVEKLLDYNIIRFARVTGECRDRSRDRWLSRNGLSRSLCRSCTPLHP